ncbi:MAG TPA: hypothetical protein VLM85_31150 [Polyangiaceae bacterium]|nr:hypothetical protein [Polyangiaceae bacterium]
MTALEAAVGISLAGSLLAIAVPAFVRSWSSSLLVEPVSGLGHIQQEAVAFADGRSCAAGPSGEGAFPKPAPLTPPTVPRGRATVDPPETWDIPTWRTLHFRASPQGVAHSFSFAFDSSTSATESSFVAQAHGDLDGDGTTSTFEVRGHCLATEGHAHAVPGMYVESETE